MPQQQSIPQSLEKATRPSLLQCNMAENSEFKVTIVEYISHAYGLQLKAQRDSAIKELKSQLKRIYAGEIVESFIEELINLISDELNKKQIKSSDFTSMIILLIRLYCQPRYLSADQNSVDTSLIEKDIAFFKDGQVKKMHEDAINTFNKIPGSHMLTTEEQKNFIEDLFFIECQIHIGKQKIDFDLQTLYQLRTTLFNGINIKIEKAINEYIAEANLSNVPKAAQPATQLAIQEFDKVQGSRVLSSKNRNKFINRLTILIQEEQQGNRVQRNFAQLVSSWLPVKSKKEQCLDQINKTIFEELKENSESKRLLRKYVEQFELSPVRFVEIGTKFDGTLKNTELKATLINNLLAAIAIQKAKSLGIKAQPLPTLQLVSRQIDIALLLSEIDGFMRLETTAQIRNIDSINELLEKIEQQQIVIARLEKERHLTDSQQSTYNHANDRISLYKDYIKTTIQNIAKNIPEFNQTETENYAFNEGIEAMAGLATYIVDYAKYLFPKTVREGMFALYSPLTYLTIKSIKDTIISTIFAPHISNLINYCKPIVTKLFFYYSPSLKAVNILGGKENAIKIADFLKQKISCLNQKIHTLKKTSHMDKIENLEMFVQKLHELWWKVQTGDGSAVQMLLSALHADLRNNFNEEIDNMDLTNLIGDLVDLILPKDKKFEQELNLPRFIGPHREPISYMEKNLRCIAQQKSLKQQGEQIQQIQIHRRSAIE